MKLLILGTPNYSNQRIKRELEKLACIVRILDPERLQVMTNESKPKYRVYYDNKRIYRSSIDAVLPRYEGNSENAFLAIEFLSTKIGVPCLNNHLTLETVNNKMRLSQDLTYNGFLIPTTLEVKKSTPISLIIKKIGFPMEMFFVEKAGNINLIIEDEITLSSTLQNLFYFQDFVILKKRINSIAKEVRVFYVNGKIVGAFQRKLVSKNTDIKSTSFGMNYDLSKGFLKALKAIPLLLRSNCFAIDMIEDLKTKKIYIKDVRTNFSIYEFEKITGINLAESIAIYVMDILKGIQSIDNTKDEDKANELSFPKNPTPLGYDFGEFPESENVDIDMIIDNLNESAPPEEKKPNIINRFKHYFLSRA